MSKTTQKIAKDCGLDDEEALILERIAKGLFRFRDTDPEAMVEKLYRRIEKLEEEKGEMVVETDGCKITARAESHGIVAQIEHNGIDGAKKLGEVLLESFEGVRQVHVYYGHSDQPDQSIELTEEGE